MVEDGHKMNRVEKVERQLVETGDGRVTVYNHSYLIDCPNIKIVVLPEVF